MSSGLVPITNYVGAIPEFTNDECAILAPEEDYLGLAEGIKMLHQDEKIFLELSKNASERVRKQSGFEQTIQMEINLIRA